MTIADPFGAAVQAAAPVPAPAPVAQAPVAQPTEAQLAPPEYAAPVPGFAPAPQVTNVTNVADSDNEQVRITLKSDGGYDAPWITVDFPSIDAAHAKLSDTARQGRLAEVFGIIGQAAKAFKAVYASHVGSAPQQPAQSQQRQAQPGQPAGSMQAPNGETRSCAHGPMEYKTGVSKAGKAYALFSCTVRDRNQQCKAQFLN